MADAEAELCALENLTFSHIVDMLFNVSVDAISPAASSHGGKDDDSIAVHVSHLCQLSQPVSGVVLDNAQRVNPDV